MEASGSARSHFFPSNKEHSVIAESPGTMSESLRYFSAQLCGFFFGTDTAKSQEGPGVLRLRSQTEDL